MGIAMPGGEGASWAQLALDQNWRGGDDALSVLTDLPELSQISLREAPITDKALVHFARLPRLGMIDITGGKLTRAGLLKFHKQRPNVTVYCRGEALMGVNADFSTSPLVLTAVAPASGAAEAGLRPGDVIHTIDGAKISDFSDLTICVATAKAGDKLKIEYQRGGKKETVEVTLRTREAE
jgi:membrane-associated protease RseP (regulator of RpoE activity)